MDGLRKLWKKRQHPGKTEIRTGKEISKEVMQTKIENQNTFLEQNSQSEAERNYFIYCELQKS